MSKSYSIQQVLFDQIPIPVELLKHYRFLGLTEVETMVILQLFNFLKQNNDFPTPNEIANHMSIDEKQCAQILRKLIQKNLLTIEQKENEQHILSESYSLQPLFDQLYSKELEEKESSDGTIFILFEQEFGRPLSPFEIEMINGWLDEDQIEPALIKAGLRESVLMGKLNFKYIDRILREWKKKGIHTVDQARKQSRNYHSQQTKKQENAPKKSDTSIYYNWLEGED
ncbi:MULTISPECIES: DnaD domain-containing protein [Bacillaceae]|uniref:Chromosome replication protein DnaD n=1 Tax=Oceanobacillus caeni TaxID=405946 RepID=A0ABR5MJW6_9BACI|nr:MULTISPECIES: DnaD domain-containing protein [Bacillaceae]KPH76011.1 chromosome replication protein DnaD [Oceanobacillus caeni]MED4474818.1 DnaD domain-containing protein [Oceanobacillus caeni]